MPSKFSFHMLVLSTLVCVALSQTSLYGNAFAADEGTGRPEAGGGAQTAQASPPATVPAAKAAVAVADPDPADPSIAAIKHALTAAAVAHGIPPQVLYAVAYQESRWQQTGDDGQPLVSDDGGIGIMQVTSYSGYDLGRLQSDTMYNINAGADILSSKFGQSPRIGDGRRDCYENWYFAVWAYNGWTPGNSYQDAVWSLIATAPNGWWAGVPVSPVPAGQLQDGLGVPVPTPQPQHLWSPAQAQPASPPAAPAAAAKPAAPDSAPRLPDGQLVSGPSGGAVYVIRGGRKRHIPNPATFRENGFDSANILILPAGELALIPDGEPLTGTMVDDRKLDAQLTRAAEQNPQSLD